MTISDNVVRAPAIRRLQATLPPEAFAVGLCALIGLAFMRSPFDGNGDTSWLIFLAGRMLDGAVIYRDLLEVNPPMSVYLYLGPVWLSRTLGGAAELWVCGLVCGLAGLAVWLSAALAGLCGLSDRRERLVFVAAVAFALLVLPSRCFAQREHVALIALVPYILTSVALAQSRGNVGGGLVLVAGLCGGLAACIKPHFALVIAFAHLGIVLHDGPRAFLPVGTLGAWLSRLWRDSGAGPHALIAAGLMFAYLASIPVLHPEFFSVMYPRLAAVYLPFRLSALELLATPAALAGVGALALLLRVVWPGPSHLVLAMVAAGAGGLIVYLVQGKGFDYHQLPALGLFAVGFGAVFAARLGHRRWAQGSEPTRPMVIGLALVLGVVTPALMDRHETTRALERELSVLGRGRTILIATSNLGVNFPLVRRLDAVWVGRSPSQWMTNGGAQLLSLEADPGKIGQIRDLLRLDREMFVEDALKSRPDILGFVADGAADAKAWAMSDPRMVRLMADYTLFTRQDGVHAYVRNDVPRR